MEPGQPGQPGHNPTPLAAIVANFAVRVELRRR